MESATKAGIVKIVSSVLAIGSAALTLVAVGQMLRDGMYEGQGPEAVIATAIPIVLAGLAVFFVARNRKRATWIIAALFVVFIVVTAFSLGPYFWFAAGAAVLAAIVLQLSSGIAARSPN